MVWLTTRGFTLKLRPQSLPDQGKVALPRGLAPRTSAFAKRRADLLHFGSMEKWWAGSVTLRHWSARDIRFTGGTCSLHGYQPTKGKWLQDVESHHDQEAYETSRVLNLPAIKIAGDPWRGSPGEHPPVRSAGLAPASPDWHPGILLVRR